MVNRKVSISLPEDLLNTIDELSKQLNITRSELITSEVLIGQEIVNGKIKSLTMNSQEGYTAIEV